MQYKEFLFKSELIARLENFRIFFCVASTHFKLSNEFEIGILSQKTDT